MGYPQSYHFILIEDSKLDAFIGEKIIRGLGYMCRSFRAFLDPSEALAFIANEPRRDAKTIVLLDIQMPLMTGFEFIEQYEMRVSPEKRQDYRINMLSSSINEQDLIRASSYESVNMFLNKPLKKEMLLEIVASLNH